MSHKQKVILCIEILLIVLMGLFPPCIAKLDYAQSHLEDQIYGFIFIPPKINVDPAISRTITIDILRLSVEWITVLFAISGLLLLFRE